MKSFLATSFRQNMIGIDKKRKRDSLRRRHRLILLSGLAGLLLSLLLATLSFLRFADVAAIRSGEEPLVETAYQAMTDLQRNLGYGGLIHNFKNLVLHGDLQRYQALVEADIELVRDRLDQLALLFPEGEEGRQLVRLRSVIDEYAANYLVVRDMLPAGLPPTALDERVSVNDQPALQALQFLNDRIEARSLQAANRIGDMHRQAVQQALGASALFAYTLLVMGVALQRTRRRARRSEEQLHDNAEQLAITLRSIGDGVLATDLQGRITWMNNVAEELTGWTQEDAAGRPVEQVFHIIHEETRDPLILPVEKVLATGAKHDLANHTLLVRRDGSETPIADSAAPILDPTGAMSGVVLVFRDFSTARELQRQQTMHTALLEEELDRRTASLQRSERQHRLLLGNLQGMAYRCRWDEDWKLVYASEGCRGLLGFEPAELTDGTRKYSDLVHPDDVPALRACWPGDAAKGQAMLHEYRVVLPDGRVKWVWDKWHLRFEADSAVPVVDGFITDITLRKINELAMSALSSELAGLSGERLYQQAVLALSKILAADVSFICVYADPQGLAYQTSAFCVEGRLAENFRFPRAGSPCADVTPGRPLLIASDVVGQYPGGEPLRLLRAEGYAGVALIDSKGTQRGQLGIMSRSPLREPGLIQQVLEMFAIRVATELERQESEQCFLNLFEHAPDAEIMTNAAGNIVLVNKQAEDLFGYSRSELIGRPMEVLMPERFAAAHVGLRLKYAENSVARRMGMGRSNMYGKRKDGAEFPVAISLSPVSVGEPPHTIAAIRDITERVAMERKLIEEERFNRAALDALSAHLAVLDQDGNIIATNQAWEAFAMDNGLPLDAAGKGVNYLAVCDQAALRDQDEVAAAVATGIRQVVAGELTSFTQEYPCHTPARNLWFQCRITRFPGDGPVYVSIAHENITERKSAEEEVRSLNMELEQRIKLRTQQLEIAREAAEAANRAKTAFLANMSHEIRTPLHAITGLIELIEWSQDEAERASMLALVDQSAKALTGIISDVLDLSKIEAGMFDINMTGISLRQVVDMVINVFAITAREKRLQLVYEYDEAIPAQVQCDPLRLRQVLYNLVGNAVKFTPEGSVRFSVRLLHREQERVRIGIEIADTGIGIRAESLDKLFRPFVQGDEGIAKRYGGTGLGLVIAKRLTELLGGELHLASEKGKGTSAVLTFDFALRPALQDGAAAAEAPAPAEPAAGLPSGPRRVLVVDDNAINRLVLSRQLSMLGCDVDEAAGGSAALSAWQSGSYDAVITDCLMPDLDGYQLARQIRAAEQSSAEGTRILLLGCTANALSESRELCVASGMDGVLIKPVGLEKLKAELARTWRAEKVAAPKAAGLEAGQSQRDSAIDLDVLENVSGGGKSFKKHMLDFFLEEKEPEIYHLCELLTQPASMQSSQLAHRLKGAASTIGATSLAAVCHGIEAVPPGTDLSDSGLAEALAREFELVKLCIENLRRQYE